MWIRLINVRPVRVGHAVVMTGNAAHEDLVLEKGHGLKQELCEGLLKAERAPDVL